MAWLLPGLVVFGLVGSSVQMVGCGAVGEAVVEIHEQTFSVDRDAFDGLFEPVAARAADLAVDDPELRVAVLDAKAALDSYPGDIPATAAVNVALVCDIHDALVVTSPTPLAYQEHYLRSTQILRGMFAAANEPLLTR